MAWSAPLSSWVRACPSGSDAATCFALAASTRTRTAEAEGLGGMCSGCPDDGPLAECGKYHHGWWKGQPCELMGFGGSAIVSLS